MNPSAEFDIIGYGASGYTGRLVCEYLAQRYGVGGEVKWAMAGRSAEKLRQVRDELNLPGETPLVLADANATASCAPMTLAIQFGSPVRPRQSVPALTHAATSGSP